MKKPKLLSNKKIDYDSLEPYFQKKIYKQRWYLTPVAWLLSLPAVIYRRWHIRKSNMKGLKPPYFVLANHAAFDDFKMLTYSIFPHRANYVIAIDAFIKRCKLLELVGGIAKRKFVNDVKLIKNMLKSLKENKNILVLYPEARYSLSGTTAIIPESLGKFIKLAKVPVVSLLCHGHYLADPVWSEKKRYIKYESEMSQILTAEDTTNLPLEKINSVINNSLYYNEFEWLNQKGYKLKDKNRAKGVHKVLYQCPNCKVEHQMNSDKDMLWCEACGKKWQMGENCEFHALSGETEFKFLPEWYEWERSEVSKLVKSGKYEFEDEVMVRSLVTTDGYVELGNMKLIHNENGFKLFGKTKFGKDFCFERKVEENYSIHIEYDYDNTGDCIDISDIEHTFFVFPKKKDVITKIHFAVEELYKNLNKK